MRTENICARCSHVLVSGQVQFFEVKIEAVADPGAPDLMDLIEEHENLGQAYRDLIDDLEAMSRQEAMEQIATSRVIFLCPKCFREWIEDPVGVGHK